ncbi:serine hydrolase family protein [Candidatus Peregrinibacteria bacterium]|jgi:uncharacterized protein|nr:serine hydrolase family protein [Candidatus Peregrinibacteria bacterium]MBT4631548.1 serine hydrolase family protein [Candidatus Peregrinibacteria bacterium]MBT5824229.1 serine hydrolase family protein [Candidatus Peregrinibacteria bacterium]
MANVLIVHGVGGDPNENWFPWLKIQLEELGHKVIIPQFPTPKGQILSNWLEIFEKIKGELGEQPILIGHNLGVPFVVNIIEKNPVKAAFLVAGFTGIAGNQFDESMKTFAQKPFDWQQIKKNCKKFYIFHSDNDPYIKIEKAEELANNLDTQFTLVPGGGHLNASAGYTHFDLLLEKIKHEL